jgi:Na+/melibiose symporter-like transporter
LTQSRGNARQSVRETIAAATPRGNANAARHRCTRAINLSALFGLSALALFRNRSFRFQWLADLLTACAFEMETLILSWYVLTETGSVLLLTLFGAMQFGGTLISPMFGVVGDRIGHRNLLCGMRAVYVVLGSTLMTTALAGALTPTRVFLIAGAMGLIRPSDLGVRLSMMADIVGAHELMTATAVARTTSDTARVGGALTGAGMFAVFGIGPAYIAVVSLYASGLLLTLAIPRASLDVQKAGTAAGIHNRPSPWHDLKEGLAYAWSTPQLLAALLLAFLVNMTAYPLSNGLLPYVAKEIYHIDQTGLGYLVASFAAGALVGSVAISVHGKVIRPARTMIVSAIVWYAMLLVFAHVQTPSSAMIVLMLAGLSQSICMVTLFVVMLRISSEKFRGRVMGVRMLVIYSLPLGLLAAGALIDLIGFGAMATLYAAVGLLLTVAIAVRWQAVIWHAQTLANAR